MELKLNKIYRVRDDNPLVHISIEANYGWQGEMHRDILQINYYEIKREAYLTAKMLNPGVGTVAARIIELVTGSNYQAGAVKDPARFIIEQLAEKLSLQYNPHEVEKCLG